MVENGKGLTTMIFAASPGHLPTSYVVESPLSRVRLRTVVSRRFKSQVYAICLIWKTMMVAEMSSRKLDAPELVANVIYET